MAMVLKPQDILVVLKLISLEGKHWTYAQLATQLNMSPSQLHSAVKRLLASQLATQIEDRITPNVRNLQEFLIHGLKYMFVPEQGEMTRGIPTGYAAPPLNEVFGSYDEPPPVWPDPDGKVRGIAFSPIYTVVPKVVSDDPKLYELLVLIDAIRGGRARERELAIKELKMRLDGTPPA